MVFLLDVKSSSSGIPEFEFEFEFESEIESSRNLCDEHEVRKEKECERHIL